MKLFLLLISYVIFPFCLPNVLFSAEQGGAKPGTLYSCCLACQHDPCLCSMPFDDMVTSEIPPTTQQQPIRGKRYQCTYPGCEATYKYSSSLKIHERTHTGEKPYKCPYPDCKYASAYLSHLTTHKRTHAGEKPYKCRHPGCEYAAAQSSHLTIHMSIHTGERSHKCPHPDCEYAAVFSSHLARHMHIHTGEKPYKCQHPDCKYAASNSSDLARHRHIHTGEKPYECNSCKWKYRRFSCLRAHLKKIHGIEIPPKKGGRPPKRTQENLDDNEAGAPEDQGTRQVYLDAARDLLEAYHDDTLQRDLYNEADIPEDQEAKRVHRD